MKFEITIPPYLADDFSMYLENMNSPLRNGLRQKRKYNMKIMKVILYGIIPKSLQFQSLVKSAKRLTKKASASKKLKK